MHKQPNRTPIKTFRLFVTAALLAASLAALAPPPVAHADTIVVNTTDDEYDTDSSECSLREAIQAAYTNATFGGCSAGSGADTITLPAGTYTLTIAGAGTDNASGDLDIYSSLTINGDGADTTIIDGNQLDRVIEVNSGNTATLNGVTITNGQGPNGTQQECGGGGVHNSGTLTIQNSVVRNNAPGYITGASSTDYGCWGGGVYSDGTLTIENSTIRDNAAGDANGSHYGGLGGGIYVDLGGTATIQDSTISGNATGTGSPDGDGGGVYSEGTLTIENTTISGNNYHGGLGGGLFNARSSSSVTLTHCTITGNTGNDRGGGIYRTDGTVNLKNSIVAGNDGNPNSSDDCSGTITSQGYNLVGSGTGCPSGGTGDQTTSDPRLGPLQDNGGPTETHALLYDSPAVEAIPPDNGSNNTGCGTDYTSDQRGESRPQGGLCDVGAYESPYIVWDGGGGADNNTSTAANWSGDTVPATTDVPVFDGTNSNNATVNANLTTGGWLITAGYGGSISQGSSGLTVNGDWTQSGGTFSGGSGALDLSGAFDLSGGTFTAPSGLMAVSGGFHHTGGTFDPNGGHVVLDNTTNQTLATSFNDLYLNDGLLAYWKLDEGSGATAVDASGYGYDGTLYNSPVWNTATPTTMDFHDPYSLGFNRTGNAEYVLASNMSELTDAQTLTLSAWVRLASTPYAASDYTYMRFITLENEKAVLRYYDYDGTHKLQFLMRIGGSLRSILVDYAWATDTWYHVAGTYDGSDMRLYLDGSLQGSPLSATGTVTTGNGVRLSHSSNDEALDGLLDDVRIYNRALSATEISDLANGKHPQTSIATTSLAAALDVNGDLILNSGTLAQPQTEGYWKLDEGSGTTAADSSTNGYDGTLTNSPTWSTNTPSTHFTNPASLSFDRAAAEYVNIPGTTNIDSLQELSLSAWVNLASTPSAGGHTYMRFISLGTNKAVLRYHDDDGTARLEFYMTIGGSTRKIDVDYAWTIGTWYHVAGTYDGSTMRLYLNGEEQGTYSIDNTVAAGNGAVLSWSGSDETLDGLLDDVRVYSRALSAAEVQALADGYDVRAHDITIGGDFIRNGGVFEDGGGTVTFDGSGEQTLDTDTITFYNLTVDSGSTLLDAAEFTVDGTLTNNGTLQRTQEVNDSSPVSFFNTGGYGGVTINANDTDNTKDLGSTTVKIRGNNENCTTTAGETVKRCFDIAPTNTSGLDATMRLYFSASELGSTTCSEMQVWRWNGSTWETAGTVSDNQCTTEPYYVEVTGVSSFSPFVSDNDEPGGDPTAVTLTRFTARTAGKDLTGFGNLSLIFCPKTGGVHFPRGSAYPRISPKNKGVALG